MISRENNFAFIDSQNLNLGIRVQGWELDFARFRIYLKDKYSITKAFLCIGYVKGNEGLYKYLQESGYICVFKPTLELPDGDVKGNVDAELVLYTMMHINDFDRALIISGDGDFHCLIEHLLEQKKLLVFMVPNRKKYSGLLKRKDFLPHTRFVADIRNMVQKKKDPDEDKTLSGHPFRS
ncbi:MAG: NYN domain-containing protein [Patescibacteria group bacterium]|nr:NYN domain-containing protein [Patescibacteria group bacterium]MDE2015605.1 NYN domain-containing protein [Patescibacteria group bacterium]MDE2226662.1 NYN domain-containing protein [Patescibacteria group bacterium]